MTATKSLVDQATKAASDIVTAASSELIEAQKLAKEFAAKGINMTTEEILARKKKGGSKKSTKKTARKGTRKRVVLSEAQRKKLVADLKAGMKVAEAAKKYGVSSATVMNIKTSAGLTKKRK